jgi:hypothetical protein
MKKRTLESLAFGTVCGVDPGAATYQLCGVSKSWNLSGFSHPDYKRELAMASSDGVVTDDSMCSCTESIHRAGSELRSISYYFTAYVHINLCSFSFFFLWYWLLNSGPFAC